MQQKRCNGATLQQNDDDPWITPTEAAKKIGKNRSTISRQIKTGAIRMKDGKVKLSEVIADRATNIQIWRGSRRDGRRDFQLAPATTVASSEMQKVKALHARGPAFDEAMLLVAASVIARTERAVAWMAVEAGCDMATAYALASMARLEIHDEAGAFLEAAGVLNYDVEDFVVCSEAVDWTALAAKAGEPVDLAAWKRHLETIPHWVEPF